MKSRYIAVGIVVLLLGGCSGEILNELNLNEDTSLTTGARQRLISNVKPGIFSRTGRVDPIRNICVEPIWSWP